MRIMTYNIRAGLGMDGERSLDRIAETMRAQQPDIVCFQEVDQNLPRSGVQDQPRRLEALLGMPCVFQRNLQLGLGGFGNGIATRFPIQAVTRRFLPSVGERRGALAVQLETPAGSLTVYCTHWGLHEAERDRQSEQMAAWIGAQPESVIVCGDLNARPGSASVQALLAGTGLRDSDAERDTPTFPADLPTARIDYILHAGNLSPRRVTVIASIASDHRPVLAEFV